MKLSPVMIDVLLSATDFSEIRHASMNTLRALERRGLVELVPASGDGTWGLLTDAGLDEADRLRAERTETASEKRTFAVVNTARGDIRVHAATCADVARDRKRYGTHAEIIHAADKAGIVADFMSDFIEEGEAVENLDGDFVWLACCGDLPWEAEDEAEAPEDYVPAIEEYMFPADVARMAEMCPVGQRATGRSPRGERVAGIVTGYMQSGSSKDGYTTAAEIEHEESTGDYALIVDPETHMSEGGGTLCGAAGPNTAGTGHVDCVDCRELLAEEGQREARGVYLCSVSDVATDECGCPDCEALHDDQDDDGAEVEGRVIAHQGAGRGTSPEHADNGDARAAVAVLETAGLPLADLPEEYDSETSEATGFMVVPRDGEMVYVYYLEDGQTTDADGDVPRDILRRAARALRDAGWAVDPQIFKCVRAHQVHESPAPQRDHSVAEEIARRDEVALPQRTPGAHGGIQDAINRHTSKKEKPMFETYAPRPRPSVKAVEVTDDNIAEIAELFGAEYEEGARRVGVDLPIGDGQVIRMGLGVGVVLVRHGADRYSVTTAREFHAGWIADHS